MIRRRREKAMEWQKRRRQNVCGRHSKVSEWMLKDLFRLSNLLLKLTLTQSLIQLHQKPPPRNLICVFYPHTHGVKTCLFEKRYKKQQHILTAAYVSYTKSTLLVCYQLWFVSLLFRVTLNRRMHLFNLMYELVSA